MDRRTRCGDSSSGSVTLKEVTSVMVTDYENLQNKPAINRVTLTSDTTAKDISVYSTIPDDHVTLTKAEAVEQGMNVLLLSDDGETAKIALSELSEGSTIQTVDSLDDPDITSKYVFLKI